MYEGRRALLRLYARLFGLVAIFFGLAFCWAGIYLMHEMYDLFLSYGTAGLGAFTFIAVLFAIGWCCILVGVRLTLNRPNRYGSLLPPAGWYVVGTFLAIAAVALGYSMILEQNYYDAFAAIIPGSLSVLTFHAGIRARNKVKDDALSL